MHDFKIIKTKILEYENKTIAEIARDHKKEQKIDALDAIFQIIIKDPDAVWRQTTDAPRMSKGWIREIYLGLI